ncbi:MAG: phage tail tape measure protein [Chloroflexota bacterium]|nr:phage tail tape measure protein [Chloroflexota bacterium]
MAEKIGLEGVLDLSDWDRGVQSYLGSIDKMTSASSKFAQGVVSEYGKLGGVIAGVGVAVAGAAVAVTGAAAKATFDWVADGVGMAQELEAQISGIAAVMGKTKDEVEPLHGLIKDLSIDPALKVNTFEAADAIELLARNGVEMTDILEGAARNTVLLANATDADFGTAADIATDVMSVFNIEAANMKQAVDGITSVVNNSKFDINDYGLALARGGVSAAAAGVSFDDFNAIIAFSAGAFSSGQTAGTGWANLLTRLVPQSDAASEAMRELGIITEDGANRFFNADGSAKGLGERIDILNEAFGGLSTEQRTAYAQMIFGRDAANALNSVIGKSGEEFMAFQEVLKQTDAEESARTRMDNLAGAMEILQGIIEAVQISIGEKFLPVLTELGRALGEVLEGKADVIVGMFDGIAEWAAAAAEALVPLIQERLPQLIDNVAAAVAWATEWLNTGEALNEHLGAMDEPTRRWAERLIELVQTVQEIREKVGQFVEAVQEAISPLTDFLAKHVELKDVLIAAAGAVAVFLAPLALAIAKMAAVGAAASLAVAAIRTAWEENLGGVRDFVAEVWERILEIVATGQQIMAEIMGGEGEALGNIVGAVWEGIKNVILTALDLIKGGMELILAVISGDWKSAWEQIQGIVGTVLDFIKGQVDSRLSLISNVFGEKMTGIQSAADRIWHAIQDIISSVIGIIESVIETHGETIGQILDVAWNNAQTIVEGALGAIAALLEGVALLLEGDWAGAWEKAQEAVTTAMTAIDEAIQRGFDLWTELLAGPAANVAAWFGETFPSATSAAEGAMERLGETWQRVSDAWMGLMEVLQEKIGEFLETVAQWWQEHGDEVIAIVDFFYSTVITNIERFLDNLLTAISVALLALQGDWEGAFQAMTEAQERENERQEQQANAFMELLRKLFLDRMTEIVDDWRTKAKEAVDAFLEGIADLGERALQSIQTAVETMLSPLQGLRDRFQEFGTNAVQGLVDGIGGMIGQAQAKVNELGGLVGQVLGMQLEAQSPSRLTMRYGRWAGEGFVLGLDAMMARVRGKMTELTELVSGYMSRIAPGGPSFNLAASGEGGAVGAEWGDLGSRLGQALSGRMQAYAPPATMQSYANTYNSSHQFGPIYIQTPMDTAELQYRFQQSVIGQFTR